MKALHLSANSWPRRLALNSGLCVLLCGGTAAFAQGLPTVVSLGATNVTPHMATLLGEVTPNGSDTAAWFLCSTYSVPSSSVGAAIPVGNGTNPVAVSQVDVPGLIAGTPYYYQLRASNAAGFAQGEVRSFRTPSEFEVQNSSLTGVVWGALAPADFDNDGRLDLLVTGRTHTNAGVAVSVLYRNNGDGTFIDVNAGLMGVFLGAAAWADFDNDGRLDVLLSGYGSDGAPVTQLYRNLGHGEFAAVNAGLVGAGHSSAAWGDFDNDGRPDLALAGFNSPYSPTNAINPVSIIYRNLGDGLFRDIGAPLLPMGNGGLTWGDFDRDGHLDLFLGGNPGWHWTTNRLLERFYWNNQRGEFTNWTWPSRGGFGMLGRSAATGDFDNDGWPDVLVGSYLLSAAPIGMPAVFRNNRDRSFRMGSIEGSSAIGGWAAWGDYNNDGRLDVLHTGSFGTNHQTRISRGDGLRFYAAENGLEAFEGATAAWADFDGDGRLDVALSGFRGSEQRAVTLLYRNTTRFTNTPPNAPTGLSTITTYYGGKAVEFHWAPTGDTETPVQGLNFNLRIGRTPGGGEFLAPMSDTNGWRRLPAPGNTGSTNSRFFTNFVFSGTYYWSVQAIDTAFAGSPFAPEQIFSLALPPVVTTPVPSELTATSAVVRASANPNGQTAEAWFEFGVTTNYGLSTPRVPLDRGSDFIEVSAALTNLIPGAAYYCRLVGTSSLGRSEGRSTIIQTSGPFMPVSEFNIPPMGPAAAAWGDCNNDGVLDLLIAGSEGDGTYATRIYLGDGDGTFSNLNANLPALSWAAVAWADFDNDGWLDILLAGDQPADVWSPISRLYRNNHDGTFSDIQAGLPGCSWPAIAWADFNRDGWQDFILTGVNGDGSGFLSRVYRNNGNGTFTDIDAHLPGVHRGAVAWGDFNNDGWPDLVLTGESANGLINGIYRNWEGRGFNLVSYYLTNVYAGSVAVADYDADGWLDILLAGRTSLYFNDATNKFAGVFRNLGGGNFTDIHAGLTGVGSASVAWGDYDNDGRLDILLAGFVSSGNRIARIYNQASPGIFAPIDISLPGASLPSALFGDYDNDGRLDVALFGMGNSINAPVGVLFRNFGGTINTPPQVPTNLHASVSADGVRFLWLWSSDGQTPQAGIQYNLRVGTRPGAEDVVSPQSDASGFRRVVQVGNGSAEPGRWVAGLTNAGAYFWSVQAIDGAFAGSAFAPEQMLLIGPPRIHEFGLQTNGMFCLEFYAETGSSHTVLVSSNLVEWNVAGPAQEISPNRFQFCEPTASNAGARFYKIGSL